MWLSKTCTYIQIRLNIYLSVDLCWPLQIDDRNQNSVVWLSVAHYHTWDEEKTATLTEFLKTYKQLDTERKKLNQNLNEHNDNCMLYQSQKTESEQKQQLKKPARPTKEILRIHFSSHNFGFFFINERPYTCPVMSSISV